jgi:hypothetical protein
MNVKKVGDALNIVFIHEEFKKKRSGTQKPVTYPPWRIQGRRPINGIPPSGRGSPRSLDL